MSEWARKLADGIDAHKEAIIARWLQRMQTLAPRSAGNVEMTDLRDAIGEYLSGLSACLRMEVDPGTGGALAWQQVAQRYSLTPVRGGFDIDELAREFVTLRKVIQ